MRTTQLTFTQLPTPSTPHTPTNPLSFRQSSSLPRSRRFTQYEAEARKTCRVVGPGSYEARHRTIGYSRVRGGPLYRLSGEEPYDYFTAGGKMPPILPTSTGQVDDSFKPYQSPFVCPLPGHIARLRARQRLKMKRSSLPVDDLDFDRSVHNLLHEGSRSVKHESSKGGSFKFVVRITKHS
jgi:hypothetical protein